MRAFRSILACILALGLVTGIPAAVFALEPETIPADDPAVILFEREEDGEDPDFISTPGVTGQEQPEQDGDTGYGEDEPDDSGQEITGGDNNAEPRIQANAVPSVMPLGFSAGEFRALLRQNEGGVVTLTGNIVWDDYPDVMEVKRPTTVIMKDYGIHVPAGGCFLISGPIRFEGNGAQQPLFTVEGVLNAKGAEIVALADGATAVYAATEGADFDYMRITAQGRDAIGVHGEGFVLLNLCTVTAGGAAVVSDTGDIKIDGCRVTPMPDNAEVIEREAVPGRRIQENGICVSVGELLENPLNPYDQADYYLLDTQRRVTAGGFMIPALWENLPADTSAPGEYSILCVPTGVPDWFPIEGVTAYEVPLYVVAENQPHIESASRFYETVWLRFFSEIVDCDALTLWYSVDDGQNWQDFETIDGSSVSAYGAFTENLEPNRVYLFRLQVTGGPMEGFSNTLVFPYYDSDPDREGGGDRTGADRFPQTGTGGDNGSQPGDGDGDSDGTETGSDSDSQPDADGDGNNGTGTGGGDKSGNPGNSVGGDYGRGTGTSRGASVSDLSALNEDQHTDTINTNTEPLSGVPPFERNLTAPAFRSGGGTNIPASAQFQPVAEDADTKKEIPISKTADPSDLIEAIPKEDTAKAQPSLPQPPFHTGMAMLLTGSAAAVLVGASAWIKIRRLRKR